MPKGKPTKPLMKFVCKICGKELSIKGMGTHLKLKHQMEVKDYYDQYLKQEGEGICIGCGNPTNFRNIRLGYAKTCCSNCLNKSEWHRNSVKNTFQEKYGVDNASQVNEFQEKKKQTNRKKFGTDWNLCNKEWRKENIDPIIKEKYGVDNVSQSDEIKEKKEVTLLKNYGVTRTMYSDELKEKFMKTLFEKKKSNVEKFIQNYKDRFDFDEDPWVLFSSQNRKIKCKKCGLILSFGNFSSDLRCPSCDPTRSYLEKEMCNFLSGITNNIIVNDRTQIYSKELDFYLPDYNLAIEMHGLWWHSEAPLFQRCMNKSNIFFEKQQKLKGYHHQKLIQCREKGIRLIQIFEDEWRDKQDIVKSRIKNILGLTKNKLYARKCDIQVIDSKTSNQFLEANHLQGKDNASMRLGAFYNDNLVAVMTFARPSIAKGGNPNSDEWELSRFAVKQNHSVIGIASRLLKRFKNLYDPLKIFSYADLRWSEGHLYESLGFEFDSWTGQNYWYTNGFERFHRFKYRKQKDDPKGITEWMLRAEQGLYRLWDCGNNKYYLNLKER